MLVLDHDRAGGYWGAVYAFTAIKGLQVDHRRPGGLREPAGHLGAALHRRAAAARTADRRHRTCRRGTRPDTAPRARCGARTPTLDPDLPAVVVTGSIAEMIGGGVTPEGTNIQRFLPRTIDEDQWQSADRAIVLAVDANTAPRRCQSASRAQRRATKPRVNIIGPIYGTFNMPSDLAEIRRLVEGIGAEINMVFPLGSHLADVPKLVERRRQRLHVPRVRPHAVRGAGAALSAGADRPALAPRKFLRTLGELLGLDPGAVHRAREAHHHQAALGSLALGDAGLLRHRELRHRRQRDLCARRAQFPRRRRWACPAPSRSRARPA